MQIEVEASECEKRYWNVPKSKFICQYMYGSRFYMKFTNNLYSYRIPAYYLLYCSWYNLGSIMMLIQSYLYGMLSILKLPYIGCILES